MTDEEYLHSRGRETIVSLFRTAREIQLTCEFSSVDVLKALAEVYKKTGGGTENVYLTYIVVEIERNEKANRRSVKMIKKRRRD